MNANIAHVDLRVLIGSDTTLDYVAGTRGGEYAGPCPFCGGKDRFRVQPAQGAWYCRKCSESEHWNDAIAYAMKRHGIGYMQALLLLDGIPDMPIQAPRQSPLNVPNFWPVMHHCHALLLASPKPLAWLKARGIDSDTVARHKLGYVPHGQSQEIAGHLVPPGIVIPLVGLDGQLYGLKIRRSVPPKDWPAGRTGWKYTQVKGSQQPLFGVSHGLHVLVAVEGEFDAILLARHASDLVDVVTLGSAQARLQDKWCMYLTPYRHVLVCYDRDAAGAKSKTWQGIAKARTVSLPVGKDITEAWQGGVDLGAWVGLQLDALKPEPLHTPIPKQAPPKPVEPDPVDAEYDPFPPVRWT